VPKQSIKFSPWHTLLSRYADTKCGVGVLQNWGSAPCFIFTPGAVSPFCKMYLAFVDSVRMGLTPKCQVQPCFGNLDIRKCLCVIIIYMCWSVCRR